MDLNLAFWGAFWGGISAISLPIGAVLGLWARPSRQVVSGLMAFGGGALLFALTIELFGHAHHEAHAQNNNLLLIVTMIGAVVGGLLFEGLNQILNNRGAHIRKRALLKKHITVLKRKNAEKLLAVFSKNKILQVLSEDETVRLTQYVSKKTYLENEVLFKKDEEANAVYFITKGKIAVENSKEIIATLGPGDVLGEIALVLNSVRTSSARALSDVELLKLSKDDFEDFLNVSLKFKNAINELASSRSKALVKKNVLKADVTADWEIIRLEDLKKMAIHTSDEEIADASEKHVQNSNSASAIWLGIALDGIPESLVIGMLVVQAAAKNLPMSIAFVIGVFLANLPEAMSSAVTMRTSGMTIKKILFMWTSLCVMTAVGGFLGAAFIPAQPEGTLMYLLFAMEGLAAGAMLTMIAETMLPEAFEQGGGTIAGLSTLVGFLAALSVTMIH